jgi:F-box/WD-40 domain protein MET30
MLQGILTVCCFPQLSFVSATVREMIKIDFLHMLPAELSFKILSYLDTESLCKAAQVSHRWNQLAEDDVVWHQMCQQHIAKRCKRCGWGLPVPEKARLLKEKEEMDKRAAGIKVLPIKPATELPVGSKRPCEDTPESEDESTQLKRQRIPWKEVYRNRFKVGTNWKYGRYSLKVLTGHKNGVMCLQFQDNILASGSYDATIKIWNLDTGEEIRTLEGHSSGVRCLQFHGTALISGGMDKTIKIWNWETGECQKTFRDATMSDVLSVNYVDNYLASGGKDNNVKVWDFSKKQCHTLRGHQAFVNSVSIDPLSRTVFSGSDDGTVRLWDLDSHQVLKTFDGHVGGVQQVVLLPEEFELDEVDLKDCDHPSDNEDETQPRKIGTKKHDRTCLPNLPLFPNDPNRKNPPKFMMTASLDSTIRLWHVPTAHCLRTFFGHVEGIWALVADNLRVISGAEDRMIKVWDPRSGICERTYAGHSGAVTCLASSGERLVTGSEDRTIRVMEFGG